MTVIGIPVCSFSRYRRRTFSRIVSNDRIRSPLVDTPIDFTQTAYWIAACRALEDARPDSLVHDRLALILLGDEADRIIAQFFGTARQPWPFYVNRTCMLDETILDIVETRRIDTVINLGAGFDTRPYRLPLPPKLRWIELDTPNILLRKEAKLAGEHPKCILERVPVDLTDVIERRRVLTQALGRARRVLAVSEGLLLYLEPTSVSELAEELKGQNKTFWWAFDLFSPQFSELVKTELGRLPFHLQVPIRFAPVEGAGFFTARGWTVESSRSLEDRAFRFFQAREHSGWPVRAAAMRFFSQGKGRQLRRLLLPRLHFQAEGPRGLNLVVLRATPHHRSRL
jgi:methyltransferase (TIGR00027 family)